MERHQRSGQGLPPSLDNVHTHQKVELGRSLHDSLPINTVSHADLTTHAHTPTAHQPHLKRGMSSKKMTSTDAPRTTCSRGPESVRVQSVSSAAHCGPGDRTPDM
jgi:hypothetical protein